MNTPSEPALAACPFCGLTDHLSMRATGSMTSDMPGRPYRVVCHHIDHDSVEGPVAYGQREAAAAWNSRAQPSEPAGWSRAAETLDALVELVALVRGECPRLLNEDSGGNAQLALRIEAIMALAPPSSLEADALQRTFDLQWAADQRAIKRWQTATGEDMVWPDRSKLTEWLLNEITRLDGIRAAASRFAEIVHRKGPTSDEFWRAQEELEAALAAAPLPVGEQGNQGFSSSRDHDPGAGTALDMWQPIQSVLKDGTTVFLIDADEEFPRSWAGRWNEARQRFEDGWGISSKYNDEVAWTHWARLPQPPVQQTDSEGSRAEPPSPPLTNGEPETR